MTIEVFIFAGLREIVGAPQISIRSQKICTVADVWAQVCSEFPSVKEFENSLIFSVNQEFANLETKVQAGDEIAIFPPVSGGENELPETYPKTENGDIFQIVWTPIRMEDLTSQLCCPEDGAIVIFDGIVRNNTAGRKTLHLEYDGYEPMAIKKMKEIGAEIRKRWSVNHVGIVHRLGRLEIGEASVVIAVTSAHRKIAFEACQYAIDTLKRIVPIWKKEFFEDGEVWVEGEYSKLPFLPDTSSK
jgi:molybdopterin converting factor subunit 1